jgi:uncharacterized GH25 family protein
MKNESFRFLLLLLVVLGVGTASAHDLWIEPAAFLTTPGSVVALRLRVGQDLLGDPVPRDPAAIDQFVMLDGDGRRPVVGVDGADPAGIVRVGAEGLLVIGYRSRPAPLVVPADTFNQYLKEEGLDGVAAERARRGQTGLAGLEMFSRSAKSLVLSGPARLTHADRPLGFRLELIADGNPYLLRSNDELSFRLLYEGRPLAGALVAAVNRRHPEAKRTARSDASGRVRFPLPHEGTWLIKTVHMVPAPAGSGADWESTWASLTFEIKAPAPPHGETR